jgi:hypothetical protein
MLRRPWNTTQWLHGLYLHRAAVLGVHNTTTFAPIGKPIKATSAIPKKKCKKCSLLRIQLNSRIGNLNQKKSKLLAKKGNL